MIDYFASYLSDYCVPKKTLILKRKKAIFFIFYTCIPEEVSAYHTGSAFTQHYNMSGVICPYIKKNDAYFQKIFRLTCRRRLF